MSVSSESSWLERWWPLLVILFGVTCILWLALYSPSY